MSKSLGNFYTLRDLVLKGHKPSSIRYLLASVPYRNQLNFTFQGLQQAARQSSGCEISSSDWQKENLPRANPAMQSLASDSSRRMRALDDDLNTAQAQAAVFDMVRAANAAMDGGELKKGDVPSLLAVLDSVRRDFLRAQR